MKKKNLEVRKKHQNKRGCFTPTSELIFFSDFPFYIIFGKFMNAPKRKHYYFEMNLMGLSILLIAITSKPNFQEIFYPEVICTETITLEQYKKMTNNVKSHKIQTFWTKDPTSIHQLIPKNATKTTQLFARAVVRESSELVHMVNTFCSPYEVAYPPYIIRCGYHGKIINESFPTGGIYENILFLYSKHGSCFGHFMHDSVAGIILTPQEIIDKSMIMISFQNRTLYEEIFGYLNISKDKIIPTDNYSWYFAKNLYVKYPTEPHNAYNIYSYPKLIEILRDKTGANSIVGYRYIFFEQKTWGKSLYIKF